ncbi:MAG: hypothetical protein QME78_01305 [Thermodesulfobacteriota bacterium]|nr:hypothetical protein [Thermodesulfobacteriota bacterium]
MQNKKKKVKQEFRKVKVWVKTGVSTYTGTIYLPANRTRFSDVINDARKFLSMTDVESKDFAQPKSFLAINKNLIELLEILEPDKGE